MEEKKQYPEQSAEKSLSFISYNLKQLNITLQRLVEILELKKARDDEITF